MSENDDPRLDVGASLIDRLARLEARVAAQESNTQSGILGTDQTIKACHDRLNSLLGEEKSAPDGTLVSNFNADLLDGLHSDEIDADRVDGYHGYELIAYPDRAPGSPDARNDEFTSTTLDGKWSVSSTAAQVDYSTTWYSHVYIRFAGNQSYNITQSYAPGSGAFSLTAKFHFAIQSNYQECGISVHDSAENNAVVVNYRYNAGYHVSLFTYTNPTWTVRQDRTFYEVHTICLHMQRNASNVFEAWYSLDGYSWQRLGSYTFSITVAKLRLAVSQSGYTGNALAGIDWVRANWLAL